MTDARPSPAGSAGRFQGVALSAWEQARRVPAFAGAALIVIAVLTMAGVFAIVGLLHDLAFWLRNWFWSMEPQALSGGNYSLEAALLAVTRESLSDRPLNNLRSFVSHLFGRQPGLRRRGVDDMSLVFDHLAPRLRQTLVDHVGETRPNPQVIVNHLDAYREMLGIRLGVYVGLGGVLTIGSSVFATHGPLAISITCAALLVVLSLASFSVAERASCARVTAMVLRQMSPPELS